MNTSALAHFYLHDGQIDDRLFYLAEAFRRGYSAEDVHELTKINFYFLDIVQHLVELEKELKENKDDVDTLRLAKKYGFSDPTIASLWDETADEVRAFRKKHGTPLEIHE